MAISYPKGAVTAEGWFVSLTTGHGMPAGGRLSVTRATYGHDAKGLPLWPEGDAHGREFQSHAEYEAFVRSRGYVQPYLGRVGAFKATRRDAIRALTADSVAAIRRLEPGNHAALVAIADAARAAVLAMGCDLLDSLKFSNGVYSAAYRLKPELRTPLSIAA